MSVLRVLVVDDHAVVRAGLAALLGGEPDLEVVGMATDGMHAVELARDLSPDVVLMDLRMPVLDGVAATARIAAEVPTARVLVLTTYESDDAILDAIEAGASGYLLKAAPSEEVVAGIRSVARGDVALAPSVAAMLVQRMQAPPPPAASLSKREAEVLRLVAQGLSNPAIGERLFVSASTVKTHLLRAFEKLEVNDRTRAVMRAMELGLL